MKKVLLLTLPLIAGLVCHCTERERLNPLDPMNPITHGKPSGLKLYSNKKVIHLTWNYIDNKSVIEYNLWRDASNQGNPLLTTTVPAHITTTLDTIPFYDTSYTYSLTAITNSWESPESDPQSIIPGPFNYWIADIWWGTLSRLTYDGAHLLSQTSSYRPKAIDIDPSNGSLWLANAYPNQIIRLNMHSELQFSTDLNSTPVDIAVDLATGEVFVATVNAADLMLFNSEGTLVENISCELTLTDKTKIAVDPMSRTVWVVVPDSASVMKINRRRKITTVFSNIRFFRAISVMPNTGFTWIATDSGIVSISQKDSLQYYLTEYSILDLDVNNEEEKVWMIAYDKSESRWTIKVIEHNGESWEIKKFDDGTFSDISKIRINPGSEYPGILLYENQGNQIIRLDSQGNQIGSFSGFSSNLDFSIEK